MNHCKVRSKLFRLLLQQSGNRRVNWDNYTCAWWNHSLSCYTYSWFRYISLITSPIWFRIAAELFRDSIGTGEEYHGRSFLSPGEISSNFLSANEVPSRMSSNKFINISNHTRKSNSPMRINEKMLRLSEMGSFVAVSRGETCYFYMGLSNLLFRKAILNRLSPAHVSRRQMFGASCWALTPCLPPTLYVDLGSSVAVVGFIFK